MKIELSVAKHYVNWGLWEGIRELFQNGLDARTDGKEFTWDYSEKYERLRLVTSGTVLEPKTLLLGHSTKRDRKEMIGKFGEGYKLALLALITSGHPVTIRTGADKWTPEIGASEKFGGEEVLVIDIQKNVIKPREAIEIEIDNVRVHEWYDVQNKLLTVKPPQEEIRTDHGALIFDRDKVGQVYVGGIFVQKIGDKSGDDSGAKYGYDLKPGAVTLDRDRRMVERWSLETSLARTLMAALQVKPDIAKDITKLLKEGSSETAGIRYAYSYADSGSHLARKVADELLVEYGEDFIPVKDQSEIKEVAKYGRKGIVVPEAVYDVIKGQLDTLERLRADPEVAIAEKIQVEALSNGQITNLDSFRELIGIVLPADKSVKFGIANFRDEKKQSLAVGQTIYLAPSVTTSMRSLFSHAVTRVAEAVNIPEGTLFADLLSLTFDLALLGKYREAAKVDAPVEVTKEEVLNAPIDVATAVSDDIADQVSAEATKGWISPEGTVVEEEVKFEEVRFPKDDLPF